MPVLCEQVLSHWLGPANGTYVDATFGRGGHTKALLAQLADTARVVALDRDPQAVAHAQSLSDERLFTVHSDFAKLADRLHEAFGPGLVVDGVLFDLGVSSPQLDQPERGFSFKHAGPLDMRMDPTKGEDAATWLAHAHEAAIADVIYQYGEERRSRRIARAIVEARKSRPLQRTDELADLVVRCVGRKPGQKHPATRTFQAIRMHVNQELQQLELGLAQALSILKPGGRLVVLAFHSLEDRVVKHFMRAHAGRSPREATSPGIVPNIKLRLVAKHLPTRSEVLLNRRARSAVLRVSEKCGGDA